MAVGQAAEVAGAAPARARVERGPAPPREVGRHRQRFLEGKGCRIRRVAKLVARRRIALPSLGPARAVAEWFANARDPTERRADLALVDGAEEEGLAWIVEEQEGQRRGVGEFEADLLGAPESAIDPGGSRAGVVEQKGSEGPVEDLRRRRAGPRLLRGPREREPAVPEQVVMAEVPPLGEEQAFGPVASPRIRPGGNRFQGRVHPGEKGIPRASPPAHPEPSPGLGKTCDPFVVALPFVPPVAEHHPRVERVDALGVRMDEVRPHQDIVAAVSLAQGSCHGVDVMHQETGGATERCRQCLRLAASQVPRLVAVDVHRSRSKIRQQFVEEVGEEGVGLRVGRREGPARIGFRQLFVARLDQHPFHVPQGLQIRNEFDVVERGVGVEGAQGFGVEGRTTGADLGMAPEGEGVLDIEHQDIEFEGGAAFDEGEEFVSGGHLSARDVEHEAAPGEVGRIEDPNRGDPARGGGSTGGASRSPSGVRHPPRRATQSALSPRRARRTRRALRRSSGPRRGPAHRERVRSEGPGPRCDGVSRPEA